MRCPPTIVCLRYSLSRGEIGAVAAGAGEREKGRGKEGREKKKRRRGRLLFLGTSRDRATRSLNLSLSAPVSSMPTYWEEGERRRGRGTTDFLSLPVRQATSSPSDRSIREEGGREKRKRGRRKRREFSASTRRGGEIDSATDLTGLRCLWGLFDLWEGGKKEKRKKRREKKKDCKQLLQRFRVCKKLNSQACSLLVNHSLPVLVR